MIPGTTMHQRLSHPPLQQLGATLFGFLSAQLQKRFRGLELWTAPA
jgi:hypothetical protein